MTSWVTWHSTGAPVTRYSLIISMIHHANSYLLLRFSDFGPQDGTATGLPCEAVSHATPAQAGHPKLKTFGTTRLVHSRCLRHSDSTSAGWCLEVPNTFGARRERTVLIGYPGGQAHTASEALAGVGKVGRRFRGSVEPLGHVGTSLFCFPNAELIVRFDQ
jgi:hypothetical protein